MRIDGVGPVIGVVLALLWSQALAGEEALHFDQRTIRLSPTSEDMVVTATFPFTNQTSRTVTITKAHAGCGCITAQSSLTTVAPGATGTISVGMELGNLAGIQIKPIFVDTDHPDEPRLQLSLEVTLPPTPILTGSTVMRWRQGQVAEAQYFGVALPSRFPFEFSHLTTTEARVKAELVMPFEHRRHSVKVTVTDGTQPFAALVNIHMVGSAKSFQVRVQVSGEQQSQGSSGK